MQNKNQSGSTRQIDVEVKSAEADKKMNTKYIGYLERKYGFKINKKSNG